MNETIEEYAKRQTRRALRRKKRPVTPARIASRLPAMEQAKAVLWDVYGTLLRHSTGDWMSPRMREKQWVGAFGRTGKEFGLLEFFDGDPAEALRQMFEREVQTTHKRRISHGVAFPEVRIEEIWLRMLKKLESKGYKPESYGGCVTLDLALRVAYYFDQAEEMKYLYPGAFDALREVKKLGLRQGIISNAQFYTLINLNILLRRAGSRATFPVRELFDKQLLLFSYRLGVAKPSPVPFERACKQLKTTGISPEQTLYVGNDLCNDMAPARKAGFRCILFAGDRDSLTMRASRSECVGFEPDAVIKRLPDVVELIR